MEVFTSEFIDETTIDRYNRAGFGRSVGLGSRPALLIIDVQYRTTGTVPMHYDKAIREYPTSVGDTAWAAVDNITKLLATFRSKDWPVIYPYVAPKKTFDEGVLGAKIPSIMGIDDRGYEFVEEIAPRENDILLPKKHPSAFFGTPLASYLIGNQVDSLVVTGCSTSGCVRSTIVDAFSLNYRVTVPSDAAYDRSRLIHDINLFDIDQKYADVQSTESVIDSLNNVAARN